MAFLKPAAPAARRLSVVWLPLLLVLALALVACEADTYPRPRGYHRIALPERAYQAFDSASCPMRFEYPTYGQVKHVNPDSCFLDIHFPDFDCYWHLTTRRLGGEGVRAQHAYNEYRRLVYQHAKKGAIREYPLETEAGFGTLFHLQGNVPSPLYFFFTNGDQYALECSFYFFTSERNDSLAPVINFLRADMQHLVGSLRFQ